MSGTEQIKVTLVKSPIKLNKRQYGCVIGLGLRKLQHSRVLVSTPQILGMIKKIHFVLQVEKV